MAKVQGGKKGQDPWADDFEDDRRGGGNNNAQQTQAMKTKASELNDESSASLKRSLAMAHQTNQVAADTMIELDKQGRQIEKMERDVEIIEDNNKQAERHIRGLKTIFGSIANKFSKNKSYREESQVEPRAVPETVKNQSVQSRSATKPSPTSSKGQIKSSDLVQGDDEEARRIKAQMDDQDKDLDELQGALANMSAMATDMNREINDQNKRLDKVATGVDKQNKAIEKNSRTVKKML